MIQYTQGNLLEAPVEALINTVNEVGVMGKGIALMFREAFPDNARAYEAACREEAVHVGRMFITRTEELIGGSCGGFLRKSLVYPRSRASNGEVSPKRGWF